MSKIMWNSNRLQKVSKISSNAGISRQYYKGAVKISYCLLLLFSSPSDGLFKILTYSIFVLLILYYYLLYIFPPLVWTVICYNKLKLPAFNLSTFCFKSFDMQNHTNARQKMFKNSTIVDMVVEFVAYYIHDGGFRGQYDSALAQLRLKCLLPAHIYCQWQKLSSGFHIQDWVVEERACSVVFCEGECHVASYIRYFPLQISKK